MTEAQAAWLRKLRDEGPQLTRSAKKAADIADRNGWSTYGPHDAVDGWYSDEITPAGLAALAEHEEKGK